MEDFPSLDLVEVTPTLTPDDLYWELDDTIYDEDITPIEDDFITTPTPTEQPIIKKIVSRNVGNSRRRRFR